MKPIRCFTCGKVLGNKWLVIDKLKQEEGWSYPDIFQKIGVTRYCCKKTVMTSVDSDDDALNVSSLSDAFQEKHGYSLKRELEGVVQWMKSE